MDPSSEIEADLEAGLVASGGQDSGPLDVEPIEARVHPASRRLVALIIALALLAITVLAAGYSLLHAPPHPERTAPLPPPIPTQGAVR